MRAFGMLLLSLVASACVREEKLVDRFVEEYCEARWKCGCESPGLTQVHCESMLTRTGEEAQEAAQDAGLEYDRECAKAWLDAIDDSCAPQPMPWYGMDSCGAPCAPYHGDKPEGHACRSFGAWSDCARDLRCDWLGVCRHPCDGRREGDVCEDFDVITHCAPGLVCRGTCERLPEIGEACSGACAPGGMCDGDTGVCVQAPGFGEPCGPSAACGRNLRCRNDVCDVGDANVCDFDAPWSE